MFLGLYSPCNTQNFSSAAKCDVVTSCLTSQMYKVFLMIENLATAIEQLHGNINIVQREWKMYLCVRQMTVIIEKTTPMARPRSTLSTTTDSQVTTQTICTKMEPQ